MKVVISVSILFLSAILTQAADRLVFEPKGQANGKRVVIVTGDEEYRTEETGPMLGKILSQHHGFHTTVLFAINPEGGYIDPDNRKNIPGLENLATADLMIIGTRFRELPDEQLKPILDYLNEGKPVIGFRTATHAFTGGSKFGGFDWDAFGPAILGDGWVSHHGQHRVQGCRAAIEPGREKHDVLKGVDDIFCASDVYGIRQVKPENSVLLLRGLVTESLAPLSKPVQGAQNQPAMPLAWTREYRQPDGGGVGVAFATTMGASVDFLNEDLRRLFVNAAYFLTGLPVPEDAQVGFVDEFKPTFYGFNQDKEFYKKRNLRVEDFAMGKSASTNVKVVGPENWSPVPPAREEVKLPLTLKKNESIVILGNGLAEEFLRNGSLETRLQLRHAGTNLTMRNMAHAGFTPGFRPHPSRKSQWAFPGAEKIRPEYHSHAGDGFYPSDDEWLSRLKADTILAFYGYNESFQGEAGLAKWKAELEGFVDHTLNQSYNGESSPRLVLISPIIYEKGKDYGNSNSNIAKYVQVMKEVAQAKKVGFVDLFEPTLKAREGGERVTRNGFLPTDEVCTKLGEYLASAVFAEGNASRDEWSAKVREAVLEKNWFWFHDFQMPNGVHAYGRRYQPFGPQNYPEEKEKIREMTEIRDQAIWAAAAGKTFDLVAADTKTRQLSAVQTNYTSNEKNGPKEYLYGDDALKTLTVPEGFKVELFASEKEFPNLANPVQMSFDNKGRLWVATMPSYPHWRPGDAKPADKLLIYEDTNNDGKADKETVFAGDLSLPMGFELAADGVYVSQAPYLVLLKDVDGDDRYDTREVVAAGFDTHDTHHAISAFCADPSGGIMMCEGIFLHTSAESPDGPVYGIDGGFYRYSPQTGRTERTAQVSIPNPWGFAFDEWGQDFFLHTSGTTVNWLMPSELKPGHGQRAALTRDLVPPAQRVRPTSGLEFLSSRHFPDEMQGDWMYGNAIGFLGIKQHSMRDEGTGYATEFRQDLIKSSDGNFRPVDLEIAPDGSLYFLDWHNVLIGHMQHNARDPLRDHVHGRVYRITYPSRPLVQPAKVAGASIGELLENLKLPEYRTRYRTRRELRGRAAAEVLPALKAWVASLDANDARLEHQLLEALWVSWGADAVDVDILKRVLAAKDFRVRAAGVRVLRYTHREVSEANGLFLAAASDPHGRVRTEAAVAATWLANADGKHTAEIAKQQPMDEWNQRTIEYAVNRLSGIQIKDVEADTAPTPPANLTAEEKARFLKGHEIFMRDGYCGTCHQKDGKGLPASGFPPLAGTDWVTGDPERLVKIVLNGLMGPIEVNGVKYPGQVPMTPFAGLLNDEDAAAVLTYARNAFGNSASAITAEQVKAIREATKDKVGFYSPEEFTK